MNNIMENKQALEILEQALNLASTKGAFSLQESATIFTALSIIKKEFEGKAGFKESTKQK